MKHRRVVHLSILLTFHGILSGETRASSCRDGSAFAVVFQLDRRFPRGASSRRRSRLHRCGSGSLWGAAAAEAEVAAVRRPYSSPVVVSRLRLQDSAACVARARPSEAEGAVGTRSAQTPDALATRQERGKGNDQMGDFAAGAGDALPTAWRASYNGDEMGGRDGHTRRSQHGVKSGDVGFARQAVPESAASPATTGKGVQREAVDAALAKPPVMWSKPVNSKPLHLDGRFHVLLAGKDDLDEAGALCIKVFFGEPDSPWKAAQLRQLLGEQRQDLESRCDKEESVMFKAVDTKRDDAMVGFIEVSEMAGSRHGMGSGVPLSDTRPVVSNLAVDPRARRCGIGTALMDACEDMVRSWRFDEIILQVEEDNEAALGFYGGMGFYTLFADKGARRYDTSGFLLQNVRTTKLTMRKVIDSTPDQNDSRKEDSMGEIWSQFVGMLMKPFIARPVPSTRPRHGSASVENLFGSPAGGSRVVGDDTRSGSISGEEASPGVSSVRLRRTKR